MSNTAGFRDLSGLTAALKGALCVFTGIAAISLWSGWVEIDILQRATNGVAVSEAEAEASDSRQAVLAGLYLIALIVTGVIFLRWTYLSNVNARSLGAAGMEFTPGWAVGWYFIPFATLWKPYQALRETFKASHPDFTDNWPQAQRPGILPLWWTLWILGNFIGQAILRSTLRADTADEFLTASTITFISDALDLPLGIVALAVVAKLHAWQTAKQQRLHQQSIDSPMEQTRS